MNATRFMRWELSDPGVIAPIFNNRTRRGIYVLEFADGSEYVGQAEDVARRHRSHFHGSKHHSPWTDIVALRFLPIPTGDLNGPEKAEINRLRNQDVLLRNRTFNVGSCEPSPLDDVVSIEEQDHWISGSPTACASDFLSHPLRQRIKWGKFKQWANSPKDRATKKQRLAHYNAVVSDLAVAVGCLIPAAIETGPHFWTLSDFPSTAGGRFATLNTGNLEFLHFPRYSFGQYFGDLPEWSEEELNEMPGVLNTTEMFLNDDDPLTTGYYHWPGGLVRISEVATYAHAGTIEKIYYPQGQLADVLIEYPNLIAEARAFALDRMRNSNSNLFGRFHSQDFTDDVYRKIKSSLTLISCINDLAPPLDSAPNES